MGTRLAKGKIATEDGQPRGTECVRQRYEQRRVAICSRAMRQYQTISCRASRVVQEASNGYFIHPSIQKLLIVVHRAVPVGAYFNRRFRYLKRVN